MRVLIAISEKNSGKNLENRKKEWGKPWMLVEDFNDIRPNGEKLREGGRERES